jgi:uncharacterized membrane protein YhaH (DUF805 family)
MKWLKGPFSKFAEFSGRASRQEYWMWTLSVVTVNIVLWILVVIEALFLIPLLVFMFAVLIPAQTVLIRRLHDTNRSGWWWFVSFVPLVGGIVLLVFLATPGDDGDNDFGPAPQ